MLTEEFFSSICGPPIANNTAIAKDAGVYEHSLHPAYSTKATFKKSSTPVNCLAFSETHIFAAQHEKSTVHVYSRANGKQEATITFAERIRSLAILGDVLILGTAEGRLFLWEICTGRQVSTPPCHVQAVSCIAATPYHIVTGSDDSNLHVWSISQLLELDTTREHEPDRTLSNHRAAITSLVASQSTNQETNICISASKDKSCIIWNYQHGVALRTLLFPSYALSLCLDPSARAFYVSSSDGSLFIVDLFSEQPLLGPHSKEESSTVVQISSVFGTAPAESGPASCLALNYDGTILLSGHPQGQIHRWDIGAGGNSTELANLNAAITNLVFIPALRSGPSMKATTVVRPSAGSRTYNFTAQFESDLSQKSSFDDVLDSPGLSSGLLERAIMSFQDTSGDSAGDDALREENEELWKIINEQRALQKKTFEKYVEAKAGGS